MLPSSRVFASLFLASLLLPLAAQATEIIAHRGASADAPENTVASFQLGWQQGADADELDTYLTSDGEAIVIHDDNAKRTTGVDMVVAKSTTADLRALDAGSFKGEQWKGEKLPLLAEALATIPPGKRFFVEVKCGPEILPRLEQVFAASGKKPEELVVLSFNPEVVRQSKLRFPKIPALFLASWTKDKKTGELPQLTPLIAKAKSLGADGLDLDWKFPIDAAFVQTVKDAGLQLFVWTVDKPEDAKRFAQLGIAGITTNKPALLRAALKQ